MGRPAPDYKIVVRMWESGMRCMSQCLTNITCAMVSTTINASSGGDIAWNFWEAILLSVWLVSDIYVD